MWLATKHGFYSIIEKESGTFYVRARLHQDLENLLEASGLDCEIQSWPTADYRYRIIISPEDLLKVMVTLTAAIDYPNFKGCIAQQENQHEKLGRYHRIWEIMADMQYDEVRS